MTIVKIMQINVVYGKGSTGKIVFDIHSECKKNNIESVVYYGRGAISNDINVHKVAPELIMKIQSLNSRVTGYAYSGCFVSTNRLLKAILDEKPDIVHLHCINGYFVNIYKILEFLKLNKIRTVLTLHAEFMYTAGCGYSLDCEKWKTGCGNCPQRNKERPKTWLFERSAQEWQMMKKAFENFEDIIIVSVSGWLYDRAIQSPFMKDKKSMIIFNGVDTTNIFKPTDYSQIKKKHNIVNEKIILHVTPDFNSPIKGGNYVIDIAKRLINKNIKIIIVGYNGKTDDLPKNVIPVKHTQDQLELASYYSMADLTLLTSRRETFSMVCAESLSCGTPVVGFQAGAPETIAIKEYSEFLKFGDVASLEKSIIRWLNKKSEFSNRISVDANIIYSKENMFNKYRDLYEWWKK